MELDNLVDIINRGDWGTSIAVGKNFYRSLFRKETQKTLSREDVLELFASYKKWRASIYNMIEECKKNETMEDRKAVDYAIQTDEDIQQHLHRIITEVPMTNGIKIDDIINESTKMETQ